MLGEAKRCVQDWLLRKQKIFFTKKFISEFTGPYDETPHRNRITEVQKTFCTVVHTKWKEFSSANKKFESKHSAWLKQDFNLSGVVADMDLSIIILL